MQEEGKSPEKVAEMRHNRLILKGLKGDLQGKISLALILGNQEQKTWGQALTNADIDGLTAEEIKSILEQSQSVLANLLCTPVPIEAIDIFSPITGSVKAPLLPKKS